MTAYDWSDDYRGVVATFGPTYRLIEARNSICWTLQRRSKGGRWTTCNHGLIHRDFLPDVVMSLLREDYADEHSLTKEVIRAAVSGLPKVFRFQTQKHEPRRL